MIMLSKLMMCVLFLNDHKLYIHEININIMISGEILGSVKKICDPHRGGGGSPKRSQSITRRGGGIPKRSHKGRLQ